MSDIPNIIHQIWLQGYDNLPEKYRDNVMRNKKIHPKWKYIIWDDIRIINLLRNNKEWIDTFYKLEYLHHKVDFARYIILYIYGGIYVDMDAVIIKPLDYLFSEYNDYDLIVSKLNSNKLENYLHCQHSECLNNGIIIAKKNNNELKIIIDTITNNPKCDTISTKLTCINNLTGPGKFTNVILNNNNTKIKILDSEYLEPCTFDICNITDKTYVVHKHDGSWYSGKLRKLFLFYFRNKVVIYIICIIIIIVICIKYLF